MNIKHIYTNGCSYTAGHGLENEIEERYSKFLADKFGAEDINQSEGGGSNQRIFRTTLDWISENQDKLKDTVFVIQLTYPVRNEIWCKRSWENDFGNISNWHGAQFGHDGYTAWEAHERDTSIDKDEINFNYVPDDITSSDISWRYVISLQSFFKSNNIRYIFFEGDRNPDGMLHRSGVSGGPFHHTNISKLVDFKYFYEEPFLGSAGSRLTECDHPNAEAQIEWADKLYNYINEVWS
jgi:hypothetical protein